MVALGGSAPLIQAVNTIILFCCPCEKGPPPLILAPLDTVSDFRENASTEMEELEGKGS
jgi:hypothetical protein